jgi:FtsZ-binding cell division protein ZapB
MVVSWMETKQVNYNTKLDTQLSSLEGKLVQLLSVHRALRDENLRLRQQLAAASDQGKQLQEQNQLLMDRMAEASSRLDALLAKIPEVE